MNCGKLEKLKTDFYDHAIIIVRFPAIVLEGIMIK